MNSLYIKILCLFFTFTLGLNAQISGSSELLNSLQKKFNSLNDFSAEFRQYANNKIDLEGNVFYKKTTDKDGKLRLEMKNLTIVSDGQTVWNYNRKQNKVIISDYDPANPSILSFDIIINEYPSECDVKDEENNGTKTLILTPKTGSGNLNFTKTTILVNSDNLIKTVVVEGTASGTIKVNFSNYRLNQKLSDAKFKFTPPEGSRIVDLR
jgi:chaperone LolA